MAAFQRNSIPQQEIPVDDEDCDFVEDSVQQIVVGSIKDFNTNITANLLIENKGSVRDIDLLKDELTLLLTSKNKPKAQLVQKENGNKKICCNSLLLPCDSNRKGMLVKWRSQAHNNEENCKNDDKLTSAPSRMISSSKILKNLQECSCKKSERNQSRPRDLKIFKRLILNDILHDDN